MWIPSFYSAVKQFFPEIGLERIKCTKTERIKVVCIFVGTSVGSPLFSSAHFQSEQIVSQD
jgi:hypothetical protein